jgi:hypothetical protein
MHDGIHPLAGQTVKVKTNYHPQIGDGPHEFVIEDWWDHLTGGSWMDAVGNPAAMVYAVRAGFAALPADNDVVYGKIGPYGHLVHVSELEDSNA